ncbi:hypothetical protein P171DRAFT_425936 [Karstenula rhodostoma CBS 690.94]|uniref:Uncharacterized protein n=1 Tax=Karstenula rhodostoma CBS 690.94 TaxID=1392251 RepID=A0A9P4PU73_9PLEO|nr:hypothetical protein P171DRAFT_425936 [Karstenula rhodostoma CBS 690.94]
MDGSQRTGVTSEDKRNSVSFMSLPAELRNQIYELTLVGKTSIQMTYVNDKGRSGLPPGLDEIFPFHCSDGTATTALRSLALLNKQVMNESQSFFYANNAFSVKVDQSGTPFVQGCVDFLEHCGTQGRASLKKLTIEGKRRGTAEHKLLHGDPEILDTFFRLLQQCKTLEVLDIITCGHVVYCAERDEEMPAEKSLPELCLGLRDIFGPSKKAWTWDEVPRC